MEVQRVYLLRARDLIDHGQVLVLDQTVEAHQLPIHGRIKLVKTDPTAPAAQGAVAEIVGEGRAMLVLGRDKIGGLLSAYRHLGGFVKKGSYVVVEGTVVNGHPVWTGFGAGPYEAVDRILGSADDLVRDSGIDGRGASFNSGGYLRRT